MGLRRYNLRSKNPEDQSRVAYMPRFQAELKCL